jgi:acyl-homoserine lactone acylase PvdQ
MPKPRPLAVLALIAALGGVHGGVGAALQRTPSALTELWKHVEIIRTAHGVPHIRA